MTTIAQASMQLTRRCIEIAEECGRLPKIICASAELADSGCSVVVYVETDLLTAAVLGGMPIAVSFDLPRRMDEAEFDTVRGAYIEAIMRGSTVH